MIDKIKDWIRSFLGIDAVLWNLHDMRENDLSQRKLLNRMSTQIDAIGPGLGRVIAKLDTEYARSEFDPAKRTESDKLGEEVLKRLAAEAKARAPYND